MKKDKFTITVIFYVIMLFFGLPILLVSSDENSVPVIREGKLHEPLFGLEITNNIRFAPPPEIVYKCKYLRPRRGNIFLLGQASKGGVDFYYVFGWMEDLPDDKKSSPTGKVKHFSPEDGDGSIIVITPGDCHQIGAECVLTTDHKLLQKAEKFGITSDVASMLLSDAVDREIQAFSGKEKFLQLIESKKKFEKSLPTSIRNRLYNLRKS